VTPDFADPQRSRGSADPGRHTGEDGGADGVSSENCGTANVSTVLLDLDGVLMDHRGAATSAVRDWFGERATLEVVHAWFVAQDRRLAEWRIGAATWEEQRRNRLRDVLPLVDEPVGTDEELDALFATGYLPAYERAWHAFDDAAEALEGLRLAGFRLAVLTNGSERQQTAKLRAIGLLDAVGPVFTAGALGLRKPDPRAFLAVCDRLEVLPGSVLYVGDEFEVDVLGARSAGLRAVLLDRDGGAPPEEPAVVRSLADLLPLLLR
jgi:putative hydrolase of the HAD superfamily